MSWLRYVPSIDLQQFSRKITHQSSLEKAKWCQTSCQVGDSTSKNSEKMGMDRQLLGAGTLTIGMWPVGIDRQKVELQLNQKRIGMWPKKRSNK